LNISRIVKYIILRTKNIINHQAEPIEFKESSTAKNSSLEIFLCFIIFIVSFSLVISKNFIEIKQSSNAKSIISESINWIADIENVSIIAFEQNANSQKVDKQSLNKLLPVKNIVIGNNQLELSQNDLSKYLLTKMTNEIYQNGHAALKGETLDDGYFANKNAYFINIFYDFISIKHLNKLQLAYKLSIGILILVSAFLIYYNINRSLTIIGISVASSVIPIFLFSLAMNIASKLFFPSNTLILYYQKYLNELTYAIQQTGLIVLAIGIFTIFAGWLINNFLFNKSID
tara:strand:+ start:616 stop:1479 length:864 start_codon:yes stop_codon:yes gene_type:complete